MPLSEQQIRDKIRDMIDVDYEGQVDFVERLEIVSQETIDAGEATQWTRVVVALDLIQDDGV